MENQEYVLSKIDKYFHNISIDSNPDKLTSFNYIPYSITAIGNALNVIKNKEHNFTGMTFIDVGCGIGNICGIAMNMGLKVEGIEFNPILYEVVSKIYPEGMFYFMDIRDFENYSKYDIVYYFAPFSVLSVQNELKKRIENTIRVGSYIIPRGWEFEKTKDERFIKLDKWVWQKIKD